MKKLLAGAAIRKISPSPEMIDIINSDGRYGYTGIGDDIFVRVTIFSDGEEHLVIIASDLSRFPMPVEFREEVAEKYGIDEEHMLVGGTRSHSTVSYKGSSCYADFTPGAREFYKFVHGLTLEAIGEALSKLVPARMGAAVGESRISAGRAFVTPVGTMESSNAWAIHAPWLRVVKVEALTGETIAMIVNYSMHCVSLCWNDMSGEWKKVSGDIAGAVSQYVERTGGHTFPCSWTVGGGADRLPRFCSNLERCEVDDDGNYYFARNILPVAATRMLIQQYAFEQGMDVLRTAESITDWSDEFDYFFAKTTRDVEAKVGFWEHIEEQRASDDPLALRYVPGMDVTPVKADKPNHYVYRLAMLNGIAFTGVNGVPYSENYKRMADTMPAKVTLLFDDCYETVSSIPVPEEEEQNIYGHCALQSKNYSAREAQAAFLDAFRELGERYMEHKKS